jgi:hypothetical protein
VRSYEAVGHAGGILGEAVVTAVYLQNWFSTKCLVGRTPYEAWHGRKPVVSHLHVFGCQVFVKQLGHIDKLADHSHVRVFIGYAEGAKAYRILHPVARQVCSTRDVVFNEAHNLDWVATVGMPSMAEFTVEYIYAKNSGAAAAARPASPHSEHADHATLDAGHRAESTIGGGFYSCRGNIARVCDVAGR